MHKIAVRSYKQPFGGKNFKKRGKWIINHFWGGNLKCGLIKTQIWKMTVYKFEKVQIQKKLQKKLVGIFEKG